jgi:hypothetical protein
MDYVEFASLVAHTFADIPRLEAAMEAFPACLAARGGPVTPTWRTADWTYLPFHGGQATPRPCYGERALEIWSPLLGDDWGPRADA